MVLRRKIKILELTNYSAGICGVWQRVMQESKELAEKGYVVRVFSSNTTKASSKLACNEEKIGNIRIKRFPFKKLGGESFMFWLSKEAKKQVLEYSPDIIIAHAYSHSHTLEALNIAEELRKQGKQCKVFLVTHAPFKRSETRSLLSKISVFIYDLFIGKNILNKFDKIVAITKWEIPYLERIGVKHSKIAYIPNGIPEEFFKIKATKKQENKILFLGRIAPIKNLEIPIKAMNLVKDKKIKLELIGPAEENYKKKLQEIIKIEGLNSRIFFSKPVYNIKEKIKKLDSAKIFVLPSKSEGMPQSLIEAMARQKIVIASNIPASHDLIHENKNGFIFETNKEQDLAKKINFALYSKNSQIAKNARKSVELFNWKNITRKLEKLF